jgi:hypothetical protein
MEVEAILWMNDIVELTGKHRCTIHRWMHEGTFPKKRCPEGSAARLAALNLPAMAGWTSRVGATNVTVEGCVRSASTRVYSRRDIADSRRGVACRSDRAGI